MSEKETPDTVEEQVNEEVTETGEEMEASADETHEEAPEPVEEIEASTEDIQEETEVAEEPEEEAPQAPAAKKGLMERRPSYSQSSVPNAHRGYSGTPPIIMLLIISVFLLLSIIFATAAVTN